jgi:hypothetical protein
MKGYEFMRINASSILPWAYYAIAITSLFFGIITIRRVILCGCPSQVLIMLGSLGFGIFMAVYATSILIERRKLSKIDSIR